MCSRSGTSDTRKESHGKGSSGSEQRTDGGMCEDSSVPEKEVGFFTRTLRDVQEWLDTPRPKDPEPIKKKHLQDQNMKLMRLQNYF